MLPPPPVGAPDAHDGDIDRRLCSSGDEGETVGGCVLSKGWLGDGAADPTELAIDAAVGGAPSNEEEEEKEATGCTRV